MSQNNSTRNVSVVPHAPLVVKGIYKALVGSDDLSDTALAHLIIAYEANGLDSVIELIAQSDIAFDKAVSRYSDRLEDSLSLTGLSVDQPSTANGNRNLIDDTHEVTEANLVSVAPASEICAPSNSIEITRSFVPANGSSTHDIQSLEPNHQSGLPDAIQEISAEVATSFFAQIFSRLSTLPANDEEVLRMARRAIESGGIRESFEDIRTPAAQVRIIHVDEAAPVRSLPSLAITDGSESAISMLEGFYSPEHEFTWSKETSSISVPQWSTLYFACNYLNPGEKRVIQIEDNEKVYNVTIGDQFSCIEVELIGNARRIVRLNGDGKRNPQKENRSGDDRDLSFQVYTRLPSNRLVLKAADRQASLLLFVGDDKKELDSLRPVFNRMREEGYPVMMLSVHEAIKITEKNYARVAGYVIAMGGTYERLNDAGCRGSYIYLEHGVSPIKQYTYGSHYLRYDLTLLPGSLWTSRLESLFPRIKGRCKSVGYPKLHDGKFQIEDDRMAICERLHVDPTKPIVMFAPTWSGGNRSSGIFNLQYFSKSANLIVVPHDGDMQFTKEFSDQGYNIVKPRPNESISNFYDLADILVSDVSSTAIEFAFLGKPVVCLDLNSIPDFDAKFNEGFARLRVPHTPIYWDFCEWCPPESVNESIKNLIDQKPDKELLEERQLKVRQFVDCCGAEAIDKAFAQIIDHLELRRFAPL